MSRALLLFALTACLGCREASPTAPTPAAPRSRTSSAAPGCAAFCECWRLCSPYAGDDPCPQCKQPGCSAAACSP